MKTRFKKLQLHRETLRNLGATQLRAANGGTVEYVSEFPTQCPGLCETGNGICGPIDSGPLNSCVGSCTAVACFSDPC